MYFNVNKNQNNTYDIQFEDETILKNIYKFSILCNKNC